jgi:hypothetical protein
LEATSFDYLNVSKLIQDASSDLPETTRRQLAERGASLRDTFLFLFNATFTLLYVVAEHDIGIEPVWDTHPDIFINLALAAFLMKQKGTEPAAGGG